MQRDPLTTTQNATNVGTDVSVGPGETLPELEGDRRPGGLADDPESPPSCVVPPQAQRPRQSMTVRSRKFLKLAKFIVPF